MKRSLHFMALFTLIALLLCIMNTSALAYTTGDDYPTKYKSIALDAVVDEWNFYNRECTSFVAWCLNSRNGVPFTNQYAGAARWGNAGEWGNVARNRGFVVDGNPAVGSVAWWSSGHVGWVSAVNGTRVTTEEYNWKGDGAYHTRTQEASTITGFIHIQDIPTNKDPYGYLDESSGGKGTVFVRGWAKDDDASGQSLSIHVYVGGPAGSGASCYIITANSSRPDVGGNYGYNNTITVKERGSQPIYLYAINVPSGNNPCIGQATVTIEEPTCIVTYDANGGTISPTSKTVIYGNPYGTLATPTRTGYTFEGWYTSASGGTQVTSSTLVNNASDHTLYAHWTISIFAITFNPNGGTVSTSEKSVAYGSPYGTLPTPTRAGYTFNGWFTAAEGGSEVTASTVLTESEDQTVYAHWSPLGELTLPDAIQTIDAEAFMGGSQISHAVIPASCASIESKAFANCENLVSVRILGKNTTFESDTFEGSPNVVIFCYGGSRAQRLASADGLEYHLIGVASDWVLANDVPLGAEITDRKWTFTLREYAENSSASYEGWTKYDSKRTSWTEWSEWQNDEVSESSDRKVRTQSVVTGYNMISYCVTGPQGRSYQPSPTYTLRLQHGPYWWSKAELDSARVFSAGSYFDYASNVAGYVLDATGYCKWDGSETGGYVPMFIQNTTHGTQWSYRDAVYTYYYYRDLNEESAVDPSGQDRVSNIQEWVKYIF